ncbi:MAG: hypothetical protein P4M14_06235 [Gammaproteobacteria bacterium]|nr:hypothetical protein [Gammaproteobacteria bacterium]
MQSHTIPKETTQSYVCEFPSLDDAKKYFGETSDGKVKVKGHSEFVVQTFFVNHSAKLTEQFNDDKVHGVVPPDSTNQIALDQEFVESPAYKLLLKDFYEIAKNYLIAETKEVNMTFTKDGNDQVEIKIDSTQNQPGFNASFEKHFKDGVTQVDYADILDGSDKIQSKKDKSTSFGGAGKGFAQLSQSLNKQGGRLVLESSAEHPAIIRLQSPLYPTLEEQHDEEAEGTITMLADDNDGQEEEATFSLGSALKAFSLRNVTPKVIPEEDNVSAPVPSFLNIPSPTVKGGPSPSDASPASTSYSSDNDLFSPIMLQSPPSIMDMSSPGGMQSPPTSGSESNSSRNAYQWNQAVGQPAKLSTARSTLLSPKKEQAAEVEPEPHSPQTKLGSSH